MATDAWRPDQYARFRDERSQPFYDLLDLVQPSAGMRAVDLGCGTGELTREVHRRLSASETLGLDSSEAMLARSEAFAEPGLRFEIGDIRNFAGTFDLLFSNAALQWVGDHEALFPRLAGSVAPNGQLAVQMPFNHDHPSHLVAHELAAISPFRELLGGYVRDTPLLAPERYAEILDGLGFKELHVRVQVYPHRLGSSEEVVEWNKGTLLTDYQRRLSPADYERFLAAYRERLLPLLSDARPFFYPFKRVLLWGRLTGSR